MVKLLTMSTTISRVAFCLKCFQQGNPRTHQPFLVFGSKKNQYHIYYSQGFGTIGFTPHILRIHKVIGENVVYDMACGICDVSFERGEKEITASILKWRRGIIDRKNWNDWVLYKDEDYMI